MVAKMTYVSTTKNQYVFKQNDKANMFFIVDKGSPHVEIDNNKKKSLSKGDGFGELALLYNAPRSASIKCEETCYFWSLDRKSFRNVRHDDFR